MPPSNPFSTRCIRPGAIPFRFPTGLSAAALVDRLRANGWWGEIVGPHGAGKSTLLEALTTPLRAAGRVIVRVTLRDGESTLPIDESAAKEWGEETLVIVDGYEQLGQVSRVWLSAIARWHGSGLLVTSHDSAGFPRLWDAATLLEQAADVIAQLVADGEFHVSRDRVQKLLAKYDGNLRLVLFELYDEFERQHARRA